MMDLSDRKKKILRAIIESYIRDAMRMSGFQIDYLEREE